MDENSIEGELLQVIRDLSFARELPRVTGIIRSAARKLTGADGVTFVLKEDGHCFYADEDAIAPLWKGRRFPLNACISGWVMEHGETAVIKDIYADSRIPHEAYRPTFVRSLAMVPVRREQPVAAIGAYWASEHEAGSEELSVLQNLADTAALALTNVQLWAEKERIADQERALRERAEELGRLKDQFLATVSHELRTPLNVMQGWVWRLQQPNLDEATLKKAAEALDRNTQLQARLVADLLDTSRAIAGKLKLEPRMVDLPSVCRVALDASQHAAAAKGIEMTMEAGQGSLLVWGDADRLQQVLSNVLSNAIKFTPTGGAVRLRVERSENHVCVTVTDTGIGIKPEFIPYVFEQFRQEDQTATRSYNGLGIGLAIVQQIASLHGGTAKAESAGEGHGTTITLQLPVPAVLAEPGQWPGRRAGQQPRSGVRLDGLTVLVVDDASDAREALTQILEAHGAVVLPAESARRALALLEQHTPSLILADIAMPEMDGFSLMQRIRKSQTLADVPAAALTAFSGEDYRSRAASAGFQLFLEKPIVPDELTRQLLQLARETGH